MIAQEQSPLARLRYGWRLLEDIDDGHTIFHPDGHKNPRHQWKMKRHVALVSLSAAEIGYRILWPLIGLGQKHAIAVIFIHMLTQSLQVIMGLLQVFA